MRVFLLEGGNVQIGNVSADRINLAAIDRDDIVKKIGRTLLVFNLRFARKFKQPIWNNDLFTSKKFLSGSAFHFFNKAIPSDQFRSIKPTVGDIDTQIDAKLAPFVETFLDSITGDKFGYATFVGYKKSAGQFITLWSFENPKINVQIDLEMVEFDKGAPTDWSQFSHSSDWEDMRAGVKGVFHKYIIRALTTKTLREVIILKGKKETPTKTTLTDLAFSVGNGLRVKIEPVMDGVKIKEIDGLRVFKEIPTGKSSYVTDLTAMFEMLFGRVPSRTEIELFGSFVGCLELAKKYFSKQELDKVVLGFAHTLWGAGAQSLYRDDKLLDMKEKDVAMTKMLTTFSIKMPTEVTSLRTQFYAK